MIFGQYNSPLGHNALFCAHIYSCSINNITNGKINSLINNFVYNLVNDCRLHMVHFVRELVSHKENTMELSNGLVCSCDELDMLIEVVCTCSFCFSCTFVHFFTIFNNK